MMAPCRLQSSMHLCKHFNASLQYQPHSPACLQAHGPNGARSAQAAAATRGAGAAVLRRARAGKLLWMAPVFDACRCVNHPGWCT